MTASVVNPDPARLPHGTQLARDGVGSLLQRDYWGIIDGCRFAPAELVHQLRQRFCEFPPPELVLFSRSGECKQPLQVGDELAIEIRLVTRCRVFVSCCDAHSITLTTLKGHPEAGRITFGAYRHQSGRVVFHIRSRCRAAKTSYALGYMVAGEAMQTNTWTDFVAAVARTFGSGVIGAIHAETRHVDLEPDDESSCTPTFVGSGDD